MTDKEIERIEKEFSDAQQALLDDFKKKLISISESAIHDLYTDIARFATTDAHINYMNYIQEELSKELTESLASNSYGHYSWYANYRKNLLVKYPEALQNAIIIDLQSKLVSAHERIRQLEEMRKW